MKVVHMQENMTRMLLVVDVHDTIKKHQVQIITSLKDPDIRYYFIISSPMRFEDTPVIHYGMLVDDCSVLRLLLYLIILTVLLFCS